MSVSTNIIPQHYRISKADRIRANGHKPCVIWFTGLSGSGKSTLANTVEQKLFENGTHTYVLDGDNIRHGLNKNVDFSPEGRKENIRRIGEAAKLFVDAGMVVLTAFISPFRDDRDMARSILGGDEFVEVFVSCPLEICEARDVKGLYKKARAGEIPDFTGISSPFEEPLKPEITVRTNELNIEEASDIITDYILKKIFIQK